jgi:hypothetical protein
MSLKEAIFLKEIHLSATFAIEKCVCVCVCVCVCLCFLAHMLSETPWLNLNRGSTS